MLNYIR